MLYVICYMFDRFIKYNEEIKDRNNFALI